MGIKFLCSNIDPMRVEESQEEIKEGLYKEFAKADELKISVAYCTEDSLKELEKLVDLYKIKKVNLVLGMYRKNNLPASRWKLAKKINRKWQKSGMGEIKMTKSLWYHGKKYCFLKNNQIFSAFVGSANLGFLDTKKKSQYEEGVLIEKEPEVLQVILNQVNQLLSKNVSVNISNIMRKSSSGVKKTQKKK